MTTLKQLRYALALAETGHFGEAAQRCHVSQPALSQQVRQLEATTASPLFDRLPGGVVPTPFGREYLDRARRVVEQADALVDFAAGHAGRPARPLRFGLIPTVAPYLLPDIYPALRQHFAQPGFVVSENRTDALLEGIATGALDLALIATEPPGAGPRLVEAALFEDSFMLATAAGETSSAAVPLSAVPGDRLLLLEEGHCLRDQALAACGLEHTSAARTFAATSLGTIVEFVANGQGITLLPAISLRKEAADPRISVRPLAAPGAGRLLRLVWREATPFGDLYQRIAETIRALNPSPAAP